MPTLDPPLICIQNRGTLRPVRLATYPGGLWRTSRSAAAAPSTSAAASGSKHRSQKNWAQKNTQAPPQAGHLAPLPYGAKRTTDAPGQQFGYDDDWQIHIHISRRFV